MKNKKLLIILLLMALSLVCTTCGGSNPYDEYARAYKMLQQKSSFATSGHDVTLNNNGDGTFSVITHIVPGEVILRYYDGGPAYQGSIYTQSETRPRERDE